MIHFHEHNMYNINLIKYIRKHFFDVFDILYQRKKFKDQNINNYFKRDMFRFIQYKRIQKIDLNQDSNDFFDDSKIKIKSNEKKAKSNEKNNEKLIAKKSIAKDEDLKNNNKIVKFKKIVNEQNNELIINHDK